MSDIIKTYLSDGKTIIGELILDEDKGETVLLKGSIKSQNPHLNVIYGRFQPLHNGHIHFIKEALNRAEQTLLMIGSAFEAPSVNNPFSYEQRKGMIETEFSEVIKSGQLIIEPLIDFKYDSEAWLDNAINIINQYSLRGRPKIIAHGKDEETRKGFEMWRSRGWSIEWMEAKEVIHATDIRDELFRGACPPNVNPNILDKVPLHIANYLWLFSENPTFKPLKKEVEATVAYKKSWESAPFPPVFTAVDGVVCYKDYYNKPYILLITRKSEFGHGKYALPGGFINHDELVVDSCYREILEETGLDLKNNIPLKPSKIQVFDEPNRSNRGRMITFAHQFNLGQIIKATSIPKLVAGDDAATANWYGIDQIKGMRENFFSDHFHILYKFFPEIMDF